MAKLPYLSREDAPEGSQKLFDRLESERPMPTPHIFRALAHAPEQLAAFLDYANSLRSCDLGTRLRELVILTIGYAVDCGYEIAHHEPYALKAGLTPEQVKSIPRAEESGLFDDDDLAVIRFARGFSTDGHVTPEDWQRVSERLTTTQMAQLTLTASWYISGALMMRMLELDLEPQYAAGPGAD